MRPMLLRITVYENPTLHPAINLPRISRGYRRTLQPKATSAHAMVVVDARDAVVCAVLGDWRIMSNWQPIDTAPKDGSRVLTWTKDGPHFMSWYFELSRWVGITTAQPTHWMPLPNPTQ